MDYSTRTRICTLGQWYGVWNVRETSVELQVNAQAGDHSFLASITYVRRLSL